MSITKRIPELVYIDGCYYEQFVPRRRVLARDILYPLLGNRCRRLEQTYGSDFYADGMILGSPSTTLRKRFHAAWRICRG